MYNVSSHITYAIKLTFTKTITDSIVQRNHCSAQTSCTGTQVYSYVAKILLNEY